MAWRIVIAGGGFGGLYAARTLERVLPAHAAKITLVNDVNFMLYTPLLPGAAAGTLEPRHVVVPLREELDQTDLRLGRVTGATPERNCLQVDTIEGHREDIEYDVRSHLVTLRHVAAFRGGPRDPAETLLRRAWIERLDAALARIFRALALIHPPKTIYAAWRGLRSEQSYKSKAVAKSHVVTVARLQELWESR